MEAVCGCDAADPGTGERLSEADQWIVLLGATTGGAEVLNRALERDLPPIVLTPENPKIDFGTIDMEDFARAQALHKAAKTRATFTTVEEAVSQAVTCAGQWLAIWNPKNPENDPLPKPWEQAYLHDRLPEWTRGSPGPLVAQGSQVPLNRARLYVPLKANWNLVYRLKGRLKFRALGWRARARQTSPEDPFADLAEPKEECASLEEALSFAPLPALVIMGEPGSGKTVLLQHVAMTLAAVHEGQQPEDHRLDLAALSARSPLSAPVPLFLIASRLAKALESQAGIEALITAIAREIQAAWGDQPLDRAALQEGLEAGRYLLLVDSLDEVPSVEGRRKVIQCLEGYGRRRWRSRLVLTTRPSAYLGSLSFQEPLRIVTIAPLEAPEARALTRRWCQAQSWSESLADELMATLSELIARTDGANLAENPLLLTCALLVYAQLGLLPDSLASLYKRMVDILCATRKEGPAPEMRRQILEVAFHELQEAGGTELPVADLARRVQARRIGGYRDEDQARQGLDRLAEDTGLLRFSQRTSDRGAPESIAQPWHRSFQEYLTACALASGIESVTEETDRLFELRSGGSDLISDHAWTGVLRFLVGVYGQLRADRARAFLERLHDHARGQNGARAYPQTGRLLGLIATGLCEYRQYFDGHPLLESLPSEIVEAFERDGQEWPLRDRLLALDALGRLGDPRLDDELWVEMPGGNFVMGGDAEAKEPETRNVSIEPFRISWRPITVQDFEPFVKEGYQDERWWTAGRDENDGTEPGNWNQQRFHPNHPVTGVSWFAASAFCAWASERPSTPEGYQVRLPTEAEWEYAARGPERAVFPWGPDPIGEGDQARANYAFPDSPRGTSPVGAFPGGNRERLVDQAGNVLEWCQEWSVGGSFRVMRGGSWSDSAWICRSASRVGFLPASRFGDLGFRVVLVPGQREREQE